MKLSDFDFYLPKELIAQTPADKRDNSDLLISRTDDLQINNRPLRKLASGREFIGDSERKTGVYLRVHEDLSTESTHKFSAEVESAERSNLQIAKFHQLSDYLREGDLLVFNDSKVINAKLQLDDENKRVTVNLNKPISSNKWLAFARPSRKIAEGEVFSFGNHKVIIAKKHNFGEIEIEFHLDKITIFDFLDKYGTIPLPQYIKRTYNDSEDLERYQNIYSNYKGSVAAPTAGLHFTDELLSKLTSKGIEVAFVTLHVGGGTFLPVKTENINDHKMHSEWYELSADSAAKINKAKQENRRIIAVGTTAMRTLESCCQNGYVIAQSGQTNIFITPGYNFQVADAMITNFHLPKSTLFMLVCAFAGMDNIKNIYNYAIANKMRFFSYGDSMLITKHN